MPPGDRLLQSLRRRIGLDQQPYLPGVYTTLGIAHHEVRPQSLSVLSNRRLECLGDVLTFSQDLIRQPKALLDHEIDPRLVDRRVRSLAVLVVFPLIERQSEVSDQFLSLGRIVLVEPVRKDPLQNRDREKRPGDLDQ